jgi:hypothetical protein
MNIHSLSRVLAFPFIIAVGYYIYKMFDSSFSDTSFVIIPVVALAIIYTSQAYIDNWWWKRNTPSIDPNIKQWLEKYLPYYNNYPDEKKALFEKRLVLYVETREFKSIGQDELKDVPFDIKNIIATQGIRLCLGLSDYLIKDMDRIYMYKHPFPSPKFQFLHNVETNIEDGIYIFSTERGLPGIVNPKEYYNIVLHGYAEAFVSLYPELSYPDVKKYGWSKLELIHGFYKNKILEATGFGDLDLLPVHIVFLFEFTDQYQKVFPEEFNQFCLLFNQQLLD